MNSRVVTFQKWMLENEDFLESLGRHAARRIADSILESGEVDWEEVIDGLSQDMEREMNWFAPRNQA
ncbi:MAG: hypothetical protein Q9Q40_12475 [Acidobacteriota bacterium]|nr:hypothetical protein [Acidobacteriota bacterium]MDQ7087268.1 hypothetical protein [Acidobacteriota bacterium]